MQIFRSHKTMTKSYKIKKLYAKLINNSENGAYLQDEPESKIKYLHL